MLEFTFQLDDGSPLNIFEYFLDDKICQLITDNTNVYASHKILENIASGKMKARSREQDWIPTTKEEVKLLLGVWILQGIVQKPTLNSYFMRHPLLENPIFYHIFTEKRFCLLLKYLHFADNKAAVPEDMVNPRLCKTLTISSKNSSRLTRLSGISALTRAFSSGKDNLDGS